MNLQVMTTRRRKYLFSPLPTIFDMVKYLFPFIFGKVGDLENND